MQKNEVLLQFEQIDKWFGPTHAVNNVSFAIGKGQIMGLIGENGSGKSTISSMVAGALEPSGGCMLLNGEPYAPKSMISAQQNHISMLFQEQGTIPGIYVADNIFVGKEALFTRFGIVNRKAMYAAADKALQKLGVEHIKAGMPIDSLSFEDRKLVEIARAYDNNPDLLIVDETTTALSQHGRDVLYKLMQTMKRDNKTVLFISHDLEEVEDNCDVVIIMRDGSYVATLDGEKGEIRADRMKQLMVGRKLSEHYYRSDYDASHEEEVALEFRDVTYGVLDGFSAQLHKGEILGIGGLTDCGMHTVGRLAFGVDKPLFGQIDIRGKPVRNPQEAVKMRIGYMSKNRDIESLMLKMSIRDNIALPSLDKLKRFRLISKSKRGAFARDISSTLNIKCNSIEQLCSDLSGGNKQKVVIAKWLANDVDVFVMDCPTRGIDVGVKTVIYDIIYKLKQDGKSILMISEELPELLGMCDRIIILRDGRQSAEFMRSPQNSEAEIIQYMI